MRRIIIILGLLIIGTALPTSDAQDATTITLIDARGQEVTITSLEAIVSGSGDVTEILVALGLEDNLIGVDSTSTYPPHLLETLPDIGFARRLSLEPIADLFPTVFFCTEICGPPDVLEQVELLGIPMVIIPDSESGGMELPFRKIEMVAQAVNEQERGATLAEQVQREIEWVTTALSNIESPNPRVFHFYIRGEGLQVAVGANTPANAMISTAGGYNAALDSGVDGYEPLSPEIILTAFPDYLVLTEGNLEASGGLEEVVSKQGLNATPAVRDNQIVIMDTQLLLGMSLRTGEALLTLAQGFHPDITWEFEVNTPYTVIDSTQTEITIDALDKLSLYTFDDDLLTLTQSLGFHTTLGSPSEQGVLMVYESTEGWEAIREAGIPVIVLADDATLNDIGEALNISGRVAAYQATLE